tara:strand:- start:4973 stop:5422 length:450 start_codon:yes stop_codon:yes gene_type:complete
MENITDGSMSINELIIDCNDLTNNGLYAIFVGYLVPLLSPTMRSYLKDMFISLRHAGKVAGQVASLTEFGFTKVQGIKNNKDMIDFIHRICSNNDFQVLPEQMKELAWSFSGDTDNGKKDDKQESWNKLLAEIEKLHSLNIFNKTSHRA